MSVKGRPKAQEAAAVGARPGLGRHEAGFLEAVALPPKAAHHVVLLGGRRVVLPQPAEGILHIPLDHLPAVQEAHSCRLGAHKGTLLAPAWPLLPPPIPTACIGHPHPG